MKGAPQPGAEPAIGVIGAGRLGSSLARALEHAGHRIDVVASASRQSAEGLVGRLQRASVLPAEALVARCELVWLCVPDARLAMLAGALPWRASQQVVHCSGAHGLSVLEPVRAAGGLRGCLHPLQAFPQRFDEPARFAGIVCGIEADGALQARLQALCAQLGARSVALHGVDRARYHVAAVLASNCVVALHAAAARAWSLSGLPEALAREALAPLTLGATEALQRRPLAAALTGPIARGDAPTVALHLRALAPDPELRELYRRLSAVLLALPLALSAEQRAGLEALLRDVL